MLAAKRQRLGHASIDQLQILSLQNWTQQLPCPLRILQVQVLEKGNADGILQMIISIPKVLFSELEARGDIRCISRGDGSLHEAGKQVHFQMQ